MSELWDKWKYRLVLTICVWVLLAFVFLMISIDHPLFSTETTRKIYKTVSDIILLKWVTKYQTLLAGLAALAGGLGVILATKMQADTQSNRVTEEHILEMRSSSAILASIFEREAKSLMTNNFDPQANEMENLDHLIVQISKLNPSFAILISAFADDVRISRRVAKHYYKPKDVLWKLKCFADEGYRTGLITAGALRIYLAGVAKDGSLISTVGTYKASRREIDGLLNAMRFRKDELKGLSILFEDA